MTIEIANYNESEYNEILLQAVAVLDSVRYVLTKSISATANMA